MATCRWVYSRLGQQPAGDFTDKGTSGIGVAAAGVGSPLDPVLEEQQVGQGP